MTSSQTLCILPCWETTPAFRKPMILRYHKTLPRGRDARMRSIYIRPLLIRLAHLHVNKSTTDSLGREKQDDRESIYDKNFESVWIRDLWARVVAYVR